MQAEVLIFKDGAHTFALPLHEVKEIINLRRVIGLPFAAPFVLGLSNLRGSVIPVISPYLMEAGKKRYSRLVEYASVVESDGVELAIACQKIFGVKSVSVPPEASPAGSTKAYHDNLSQGFLLEGKKIRLLRVAALVNRGSDTLMDDRFVVSR